MTSNSARGRARRRKRTSSVRPRRSREDIMGHQSRRRCRGPGPRSQRAEPATAARRRSTRACRILAPALTKVRPTTDPASRPVRHARGAAARPGRWVRHPPDSPAPTGEPVPVVIPRRRIAAVVTGTRRRPRPAEPRAHQRSRLARPTTLPLPRAAAAPAPSLAPHPSRCRRPSARRPARAPPSAATSSASRPRRAPSCARLPQRLRARHRRLRVPRRRRAGCSTSRSRRRSGPRGACRATRPSWAASST